MPKIVNECLKAKVKVINGFEVNAWPRRLRQWSMVSEMSRAFFFIICQQLNEVSSFLEHPVFASAEHRDRR